MQPPKVLIVHDDAADIARRPMGANILGTNSPHPTVGTARYDGYIPATAMMAAMLGGMVSPLLSRDSFGRPSALDLVRSRFAAGEVPHLETPSPNQERYIAEAKEEAALKREMKAARRAGKPMLIASAAVRHEGQIFTGQHHSEAIRKAARETGIVPVNGEQGFVTNYGTFLNRRLAAWVAVRAGQVKRSKCGDKLYSEHLHTLPK